MRLLFILLIIPLFSLSQTFEKIISDFYQTEVTDAIEVKEGYLISTHCLDSSSHDYYSQITLFNKQGNKEKSRIFDEYYSLRIRNIIAINDTLIFASAYSKKSEDDSIAINYFLLNKNLETIKNKEIGTLVPNLTEDTFSIVDSRMCLSNSGEIFNVFGYRIIPIDLSNNDIRGFSINKINPITLENTIKHYNSPEHDAFPQSITPYKGKDSLLLFFMGTTYIVNNELSIVDTLPDEFRRYYNDNGTFGLSWYVSADWINNNLVLGGGSNILTIAQYNNDLSLKSFSSFVDFETFVDRCAAYSRCLSVNANSVFLVGTNNCGPYFFGIESSLNLIKLDNNINLIWDKMYKQDDGYYYYALNILATTDGGCLVAATRNNQETQGNKVDMYLLKVDSLGHYTPTSISQSPFNSQNINVYPNPGKTNLNFSLPKTVKNAQFNLYDVSGKMVLKKTTELSHNTIHTDFLQNGIYIYEIWDSGKLIGRGKWMKL